MPSNCSAFDSASPSRVFVPSLIIEAVRLATPRLSAGSNWSAPPMNVRVSDTSGNSCFSDTMSSAPFASVDVVQTGTVSAGGLPARRNPVAVERLLGADAAVKRSGDRDDHGLHQRTSPSATFLLSPGFDA